jgi:hypothetical protein
MGNSELFKILKVKRNLQIYVSGEVEGALDKKCYSFVSLAGNTTTVPGKMIPASQYRAPHNRVR